MGQETAENKYLKLKEECDWEGETWIHFVLVNGNEDVIERIVKLVKRYGRTQGIVAIKGHKPASLVNAKCESDDDTCGYMSRYGKNDNKLSLDMFAHIKDQESFDDQFYKGRPRDWGDEAYEKERAEQARRKAEYEKIKAKEASEKNNSRI